MQTKEEKSIYRGPYLAELHLLYQTFIKWGMSFFLFLSGKEHLSPEFLDVFMGYLGRFGATLVCFDDVFPFLEYFRKDHTELLYRLDILSEKLVGIISTKLTIAQGA